MASGKRGFRESIVASTSSAVSPIGRRISSSKMQFSGIILTLIPPWIVPMLTVGRAMIDDVPGPIALSTAARVSGSFKCLPIAGGGCGIIDSTE